MKYLFNILSFLSLLMCGQSAKQKITRSASNVNARVCGDLTGDGTAVKPDTIWCKICTPQTYITVITFSTLVKSVRSLALLVAGNKGFLNNSLVKSGCTTNVL